MAGAAGVNLQPREPQGVSRPRPLKRHQVTCCQARALDSTHGTAPGDPGLGWGLPPLESVDLVCEDMESGRPEALPVGADPRRAGSLPQEPRLPERGGPPLRPQTCGL